MECIVPVAECSYALEASKVSEPYVLRLVVDLIIYLQAPWTTSNLYSGHDLTVAAVNIQEYGLAKPWCDDLIKYIVGNPTGFDQLVLLNWYFHNTHFDPLKV